MVGRSQYRQPGLRTSPSIHRQVRTEEPAGAACGVRSVIALPSVGRSVGRSPGRHGRATPRARPPSHQAQAQGSRERLLDPVAASCAACGRPPKSADSPSSPSWQECTMTACGDVAPVAGNGSTSASRTDIERLLTVTAWWRPDGRWPVFACRVLTDQGSDLQAGGRNHEARSIQQTTGRSAWPLQLFSII
jgi:hypothetical protein